MKVRITVSENESIKRMKQIKSSMINSSSRPNMIFYSKSTSTFYWTLGEKITSKRRHKQQFAPM